MMDYDLDVDVSDKTEEEIETQIEFLYQELWRKGEQIEELEQDNHHLKMLLTEEQWNQYLENREQSPLEILEEKEERVVDQLVERVYREYGEF